MMLDYLYNATQNITFPIFANAYNNFIAAFRKT